jgi:hypothetical protein
MGTAKGQAAVASPLSQSSQDAAWRHARKVVLTAICSRQRVAIRPSRAAGYAPLMVAAFAHRILPLSVIRHRAFNGKHAAVVVGYDEVEWQVRMIAIGHRPTYSR